MGSLARPAGLDSPTMPLSTSEAPNAAAGFTFREHLRLGLQTVEPELRLKTETLVQEAEGFFKRLGIRRPHRKKGDNSNSVWKLDPKRGCVADDDGDAGGDSNENKIG